MTDQKPLNLTITPTASTSEVCVTTFTAHWPGERVITCGQPTEWWMKCPNAGALSAVCDEHREWWENTVLKVTCKACGQEGVRISDHYVYERASF